MTNLMVKEGAELPPPNRHPETSSRRKYPLATMAVGRMFFVPNRETKDFTTYVSSQGRRYGRKFKTQTAHMRQDLETDEWEPCLPTDAGAKKGVAVTRIA